ncbi:ATP-grasp domain-containing protein [Evansella halocellulosilytica]|uniref:ATP-grasp domain-containing protein n=1 Tax=Evansella halocellulosilytica TaxID=2011013 RepID=UPI000BB96816|nr:RimK family alpha-L-glutamate ligase [Evansella halocellulosilytica]
MIESYGWIIYNGNLNSEKFLDYVTWFQQSALHENVKIDAIANNHLIVTIEDGIGKVTVGDVAAEKISKSASSFSQKNSLIMSECGNPLPKPDFIHFADKDLHLARQLEAIGLRLFNSADSIERCDNKAYMHVALSNEAIPVPKTFIAPKIYEGLSVNETTHVQLMIQALGFPFILKEAYGSFGQQVYWIETKEAFMEHVHRLGGKEYICQQPIDNSFGKDLRLNVVGADVVTAMMRTSQHDFRANVTAGGKTEPYTPTNEEIELALKAARAVGADFAGVDLLIGEKGPILCEINSNPHLRSIYECTGVDVTYSMVKYIKKEIERES